MIIKPEKARNSNRQHFGVNGMSCYEEFINQKTTDYMTTEDKDIIFDALNGLTDGALDDLARLTSKVEVTAEDKDAIANIILAAKHRFCESLAEHDWRNP